MRLLIVKLSSIGDVIHTLPAVSGIRSVLPSAEISWVVEKSSSEILKNNPVLDRHIEIDTRSLRNKGDLGKTIKTAKRQFSDLRASDFDLAIDFQGLFKSATIARISGADFRAGFAKAALREPSCRHLYTNTFDTSSRIHVIEKNFELAEASLRRFLNEPELKLPRDPVDFHIETSAEHVEEARAIASSLDGPFIILNPAGGWETKLWPAENYGELSNLLQSEFKLSSVICTAPSESELADRASEAGDAVVKATPSLKGFLELARLADGYVGGDTAPTHLAVAAKCPVIGIYGPTEWWRNGSPNADDICIERFDIDCRENCHRRECGNWICMDIEPERVLLGIKTRLGL